MSTNNQFKGKRAISWRRDQILIRLSKGYSQSQIAKEMQLHPSTISLDCKSISEQSQRDLKDLVDKRVPMRYLECEVGLKAVLKKAWEIVDNPNTEISEIRQTLTLLANTYDKLMELSVNGEVLSKGLSIIERIKGEIIKREQQLEQFQSKSKSESKSDSNTEQEKEEEEIDTSQYKF